MEPDPMGDRLMWSCQPGFVVELKVLEGAEYSFVPSFRDIEEMCIGVLETFVTAVAGIPRVGSASNAPSRRGMHIPTVGLKEDCVVEVRTLDPMPNEGASGQAKSQTKGKKGTSQDQSRVRTCSHGAAVPERC